MSLVGKGAAGLGKGIDERLGSSFGEPNGWRSCTASSSTMSVLAQSTAPAPTPARARAMKVPSSGV